jgi:Fe-S-cluster-containing dehydrogenase component
MVIQVDQELCAGCGVCVDVCLIGAIQLVDYRAEIDGALCTACEACIRTCPNEAIIIRSIPEPNVSIMKLHATESYPIPIRSHPALPETATPARGLAPLVGAALAYLGRQVAPHLVDLLINTFERRLLQPTTTAITPISNASRVNTTPQCSGKQRQARYRRGRIGYRN